MQSCLLQSYILALLNGDTNSAKSLRNAINLVIYQGRRHYAPGAFNDARDALNDMLKKFDQTCSLIQRKMAYFCLHCNHPYEVDDDQTCVIFQEEAKSTGEFWKPTISYVNQQCRNGCLDQENTPHKVVTTFFPKPRTSLLYFCIPRMQTGHKEVTNISELIRFGPTTFQVRGIVTYDFYHYYTHVFQPQSKTFIKINDLNRTTNSAPPQHGYIFFYEKVSLQSPVTPVLILRQHGTQRKAPINSNRSDEWTLVRSKSAKSSNNQPSVQRGMLLH